MFSNSSIFGAKIKKIILVEFWTLTKLFIYYKLNYRGTTNLLNIFTAWIYFLGIISRAGIGILKSLLIFINWPSNLSPRLPKIAASLLTALIDVKSFTGRIRIAGIESGAREARAGGSLGVPLVCGERRRRQSVRTSSALDATGLTFGLTSSYLFVVATHTQCCMKKDISFQKKAALSLSSSMSRTLGKLESENFYFGQVGLNNLEISKHIIQ